MVHVLRVLTQCAEILPAHEIRHRKEGLVGHAQDHGAAMRHPLQLGQRPPRVGQVLQHLQARAASVGVVPVFERDLGRTPLHDVPLGMGSYLRLLRNPEVKIRFDIVEVLLTDGEVGEVRHLPNTFTLARPYRYG